MNSIAKDFKHGKNFKIGQFCVIEEGCEVGDNVELQNYVLLKKGTKIGSNVYVDSYFRSSGDNVIGNNVTLRFGSTVARQVFVEDDVFISPNVMTVYSLPDGSKSKGTFIKKGAFIGTAAVIGPSVTIGEGSVIGANSYVGKDVEDGAIYAGTPARFIRRV